MGTWQWGLQAGLAWRCGGCCEALTGTWGQQGAAQATLGLLPGDPPPRGHPNCFLKPALSSQTSPHRLLWGFLPPPLWVTTHRSEWWPRAAPAIPRWNLPGAVSPRRGSEGWICSSVQGSCWHEVGRSCHCLHLGLTSPANRAANPAPSKGAVCEPVTCPSS